MASLQEILRIVLIGVGATAVMDAWLLGLKRMGVPALNFAFIGRWIGHLARGQVFHAAISRTPPVAGERALGWLTHYGIGAAFALLLVAVAGRGWVQQPTVGPAILVGLLTVIAPLFLMQPAMGAGVASSKTPTPLKNCLRSAANHAVFGAGLYASAAVIGWALG